jgi:hypothetical protein
MQLQVWLVMSRQRVHPRAGRTHHHQDQVHSVDRRKLQQIRSWGYTTNYCLSRNLPTIERTLFGTARLKIGRTASAAEDAIQHVRVNHGSPNIAVAQDFPRGTHVLPVGQPAAWRRCEPIARDLNIARAERCGNWLRHAWPVAGPKGSPGNTGRGHPGRIACLVASGWLHPLLGPAGPLLIGYAGWDRGSGFGDRGSGFGDWGLGIGNRESRTPARKCCRPPKTAGKFAGGYLTTT